MFAVEKSKEPGKSPVSQAFFSSKTNLSESELQKCDELGVESNIISRKYATWLFGLLAPVTDELGLTVFFQNIPPARLQDERFVRMVYLDYQST